MQETWMGLARGSRRRCPSFRSGIAMSVIITATIWPMLTCADAAEPSALRLEVINGWFVHGDRVVWGYAQHNGWWRAGQRPNLTRRGPGEVRPNRTEDLDKLTDNMLRYGYPGFEHNFGLWYDRRRDAHDTARRTDGKALSPFLEQPWARGSSGTAWDGLPKYDLTRYNAWYFDRLRTFAGHCDRKGTILLHNLHMQHALLETNAHYVDFPWRPDNCLQKTGMPASTPAANVFYDVTHPQRRRLHRAYIRKCLDELGRCSHVVHLAALEYTGPKAFMEFYLDTVAEWEKENGRDVLVGLGATKDVLDALADDPRVDVLDLRYWWYQPDGSLYAPPGGRQVPGRYTAGGDAARTTAEQIYRQTKEYRLRYPNKAIVHSIEASRQQTWAFLMGSGSMLVCRLEEPEGKDPPSYGPPPHTRIVQPTYDFIRRDLSGALQKMVPKDLILDNAQRTWCLADPNHTYLVYALAGGRIRLDFADAEGTFQAKWFDPRTGQLCPANGGAVEGGQVAEFQTPDANDWALWLTRANP